MSDKGNDKTRTFMVLSPGVTVGHYRIIEKIGAGGMGEVFLAKDTRLNRRVALKFLPSHLSDNEDMKARFRREAQAAAKLDHPNIVPVYEVGQFEGRPFIAMAHIEGNPLREVMKEDKLSVSDCIQLIMHICEGLHKAHESGIVHRDIKPGNIIIDSSGRARLLDFGLATVTGEEKLTKTGSTLGTVGYMAPEQILSNQVDCRADLFSAGVILYELITGRRPFTGDNDAAVVKAITDTDPEPIARFKSGVTGELQQIIDKALAKDPSMRYQHADEMLADLKRLGTSSPKPRKRKTLVWVGTAVIAFAAAYLLSGMFRQSPEPAHHEQPVLIVLPFQDLGAADERFFSDGIRDEIGSRLSTVEGMRVISPRSADKYRDTDKDIDEIGRETGADYVLEASIRWDKSGDVDRFRITPKLTKTSDNYMMWSDNYERQLVQIFDVQSEIAEQIVTALGLTLLEPGEDAPDYAPTSNMKAYNYYLRGLELDSRGVFMTNLKETIKMFDSAVVLDPNFAIAWAKKSVAHTSYEFGTVTNDSGPNAASALEAAQKALELDPSLPDAHIALGSYYNFIERDYDKALSEFALAESEVLSNADLSEAIGVVKMRQGKWQEALTNFEKAVKLDPLTVERYFWLGTCTGYLRDYDKAEQYLERGLTLNPADYDAVSTRILLNLVKYGTVDSEDETYEELVRLTGPTEVSSYAIAPSTSLGFWRFVMDRIDPDKMISDLRLLRDQTRRDFLYINIGQLYELSGREDSARVYYDSARIYLTNVLETSVPEPRSEDFDIYSSLGLTYALLGMPDSAVWAGNRGKEIMSIDDCHW